jgi:hypothetical protein
MNTSVALRSLGRMTAIAAVLMALTLPARAQLDPNWLGHDRLRPLPPVVAPATASTPERAGAAPSDAVVLFDGAGLAQWAAMDGTPTKWVVRDGAMECVPGSGYIRTVQAFGDCQLHLEFASPAKAEGSSQGRGNSGLFFGGTRYEIQILDSYDNPTYADGSCASVYHQYPPLVNASRKPGEWQSYDVIWSAPRFDAEGRVLSPARVTLFHNGVLVQNNVELIGETGWLTRAPYRAHPEKMPIALQDHGNPVRFRNIWVRELGQPGKPEFRLADALLDSYCGTYGRERGPRAEVTRRDGNLVLRYSGVDFVLFAQSPTHFFSKTVDVQAQFEGTAGDPSIRITVGEDGGSTLPKAR